MPRKPKSDPKARSSALSTAQYDRLLGALQRLLEKGRRHAEEAVGRQLVQTYHAVGTRLLARKLTESAGYGASLIQRLADDLGVDHTTLHRAMAFARAYPNGSPDLSLRWGHYRELLVLPSAEQRAWYAERAADQGWSAPKLRQAVREQRYRNRASDAPPKPRKRPTQLRRPTGERYFYKARIERVVDGDTILALIDLGFQVHRQQRLRLAGIDTPDRSTAKGARARDLVERELTGVDFVMLHTDKIDLYGRYVAHIFYQPGEANKRLVASDGLYLNQQLIEQDLARAL